jgi:hypothetical protein
MASFDYPLSHARNCAADGTTGRALAAPDDRTKLM